MGQGLGRAARTLSIASGLPPAILRMALPESLKASRNALQVSMTRLLSSMCETWAKRSGPSSHGAFGVEEGIRNGQFDGEPARARIVGEESLGEAL